MKKILYSVLALTMAAFTLTSCEDVPMPYDDPNAGGETEEPTLPEGVYLDQDFSTSLGNFASQSASGDLSWGIDYSSAMITGFQDFDGDGQKENKAGVTYLVSKEFDLTTADKAHVVINHALNYERSDINTNNSILISKDYTGDVKTATWEMLKYDTEGLNSGFNFVEKSVNIPATYMGSKVVIALRHTCSASQSSTWEVKSLRVAAGNVEAPTPDEPVVTDGVVIDQDFSTSLGQFKSVSHTGSLSWIIDFKSAMVTGYQDFDGDGSKENQAGVTFLVSPELDLTKVEKAFVEINHAINYERGDINDNNTLLISKNYTGNVKAATWEAIDYDTDGLGSSFTFKAKKASIPASYIGSKVVIALRHTCTDEFSSTWEVKNLAVKVGDANEGGGSTGDLTAPNGDFEAWTDGVPNNWSTSSTAGNATLSQSEDAHGGKYAVQVGGTSSANKRLGYKEMELKAGTYTMTFYAKAATATGASVRPGYVPVKDGKVGSYAYGDYTNNISNTEWVKVTHEFTIAEDGTYCLVIMNSKNPGADVLIDDFVLTMGAETIIK